VRELKVVSLEPKRSKRSLLRTERQKRYQRIDDIKQVIDIYERRIDELRTEARRLMRLNH
jgi:hypothetical protein